MREISEHILKLTGKVSLPQPLEMGKNYHISINGDINSITLTDNQDGMDIAYYKFKPITCEILKDNGEVIKGKDSRSMSKKLRALIWFKWKEGNSSEEFEEYYQKTMNNLMKLI